MINRACYANLITEAFEVHSICGILGPRQCGKTTLAKFYAQEIYKRTFHYFDLEDPTDLAKFEHPKLLLESLEGLIIIDEVQRQPELFPYLRSFVDKFPQAKLLVLGSASRDLIQQSSETLAGRISYVELTPFMLTETHNLETLWHRGGFPRSYLAPSDRGSFKWRKDFITTFLERDIASLGFDISPYDMRRLWTMLAHYHGNILNYSELARSLAVSDNTIRKYINLLQGTFMVRLLKPWSANIKKRQVKTPKIYLRDSGIIHALLNIEEDLNLHPKVGASWEGFAIEEIIRSFQADPNDCYFWSTQHEAELDLLIEHKGKKQAFEFKYSDSPKITRSMRVALEDLQLDKIILIVPGKVDFKLDPAIHVKGLENYIDFSDPVAPSIL